MVNEGLKAQVIVRFGLAKEHYALKENECGGSDV